MHFNFRNPFEVIQHSVLKRADERILDGGETGDILTDVFRLRRANKDDDMGAIFRLKRANKGSGERQPRGDPLGMGTTFRL